MRMGASEKADAVVLDVVEEETKSRGLPMWKKIVGFCIVMAGVILAGVPLYCLLTLATIAVVSVSFIINALMHVVNSTRGHAHHRKLVSPISDGAATVIILLAFIMLLVWLVIVQVVDNWEHHVLASLQVGQWIKIFIVILGYYFIRNATHTLIVKKYWVSQPSSQGQVEAVNCLLLLPGVLLIMRVVPIWKHRELLGLLIWKWICALILVVLAQNMISLAIYSAVNLLQRMWCPSSEKCQGSKCKYYYAKGLRRSITFVFVALMHLLTWRLYFCPRFIKNSAANKVSDFGTWTFVSELICGILWFIKKFILLSWKAHTIYERSTKRIVYDTSDKDTVLLRKLTYWYCLYYLGLIKFSGLPQHKSQPDKQKEAAPSGTDQHTGCVSSVCQHSYLNSAYKFLREKVFVSTLKKTNEIEWERKQNKWNTAIATLMKYVEKPKPVISIHDKPKIARAFLLDDRSLPEDQEISSFNKTLYNLQDTNNVSVTSTAQSKEAEELNINEILTHLIDKKESVVTILCKQLQVDKTEMIQAEYFRAWMEKAHQNCLQMQQFMISAHRVLKFLNTLVIGFIIAVVIITWLMLTEILPTKVIVVITSPVLAATFIFGDAVKTMFQGVVFAYIMHPFTIGDICVIDKTQMEVKQIGIWRTTFTKLGTEEEVLYPNSVLAGQAIINYEDDIGFQLQHDSVELSLSYDSDQKRIDDLKYSINGIVRLSTQKASNEKTDQNKRNDKSQGNHDDDHSVALKQKENENDGIEPASASDQSEMSSIPQREKKEEITEEEQHNTDDDHLNPASEKNNGSECDDQHKAGSNDIEHVVVKQIQDDIKMAVHFEHDDNIFDMTNAQAFNEKLRKKSDILRQIADELVLNRPSAKPARPQLSSSWTFSTRKKISSF